MTASNRFITKTPVGIVSFIFLLMLYLSPLTAGAQLTSLSGEDSQGNNNQQLIINKLRDVLTGLSILISSKSDNEASVSSPVKEVLGETDTNVNNGQVTLRLDYDHSGKTKTQTVTLDYPLDELYLNTWISCGSLDASAFLPEAHWRTTFRNDGQVSGIGHRPNWDPNNPNEGWVSLAYLDEGQSATREKKNGSIGCTNWSKVTVTITDLVGVSTHKIVTKDGIRYYKVYAPESEMTNRPVWLFLHGGGQSMAIIEPKVGGEALRNVADKNNVLIVVPNGTDNRLSAFRKGTQFYGPDDDLGVIGTNQRWHDDTIEGLFPSTVETIDDVAFLKKLVNRIHTVYKTEKNQTYIGGISNGGFMTQKMLLEAPEQFAAAAAALSLVPAPYRYNTTVPSNRIPLVMWHGSEEAQVLNSDNNPNNDIDSNALDKVSVSFLNTRESLDWWAAKMGATKKQDKVQVSEPDQKGCYTTREQYNGEKPVFQYISVGGGHVMPSRTFPSGNPDQCEDVNGIHTLWNLMSRYSRQ